MTKDNINTSGRYSGMTFKDFHKYRMARYTGLANQHDTNFDHFIYSKDVLDWNWYLALDEQHKALSIDYAHGMELDDWGDDVDVQRNGLSDDMYRFLIKSKRLYINSKGTFPDIIKIASNLLGCDPSDIKMSNDRKWVNGQLVGEENTINIDSINYENVNNVELIPMLAPELENATLASTKVRAIGFYEKVDTNLYIGTAVDITEHLIESVEPGITEQSVTNGNSYIGVQPVIHEQVNLDTGNTIVENFSDTNSCNLSFGIYVPEPYVITKEDVQHFNMSINDGIVSHSHVDVNNFIGNLPTGGSRVQI